MVTSMDDINVCSALLVMLGNSSPRISSSVQLVPHKQAQLFCLNFIRY